jgi:hypothetical protein
MWEVRMLRSGDDVLSGPDALLSVGTRLLRGRLLCGGRELLCGHEQLLSLRNHMLRFLGLLHGKTALQAGPMRTDLSRVSR